MSVNKAIIIGNLGADPEVRYTQSNIPVATLSIATTERYRTKDGQMQESTEWHRCVAWNRLAEIAQQYLKKGSKVYVEGPIQTRSWEDQSGQKRYTTEIKVLSMQMLDSRDSGSSTNNGSSMQMQEAPSAASSSGSIDVGGMDSIDDDLPF